MKESFPSPEPAGRVEREQVIAAYRKFVEKGVTNPDDLDLDDPEVQEANNLFYKWQEQIDIDSAGDDELALRAEISKIMLYVDAGFTDPEYLDEVLKEWIPSQVDEAKKQGDNPGREETRRQIAVATKKIRAILGRSE